MNTTDKGATTAVLLAETHDLDALRRLLKLAQGDSQQGRFVAKLLMSHWNRSLDYFTGEDNSAYWHLPEQVFDDLQVLRPVLDTLRAIVDSEPDYPDDGQVVRPWGRRRFPPD